MEYNFEFGKKRATKKSPKRSPKRKTKTTKKSSKLTKKMLDTLSLKKLQKLAKKYKVSVHKKSSTEMVKKSTLLKRLKSSRSVKKILESAHRMKTHTKFGNVPAGVPSLYTPLELKLGQTYEGQRRHYQSIPKSLLSYNFQGNGTSKRPGVQTAPKNFKYNLRAFSSNSLPPYLNVSDPNYNKFGRYFH